MVFSSVIFLFYFLPIALLGNYLLKSIQLKNIFLLLMSLVFYASGEGVLVVLVLISTIINYFSGVLITVTKHKKLFLSIGVLLNLSLLFYYKYINFIIENLNLSGFLHLNQTHIILPIGISFFTFHGLSYIVDVYRDKSLVQRNFPSILLYITFFPQLVAGPIVRYHDIAPQLFKRETTFDKTIYGIKRFMIGLSKKVLLANSLGALTDQILSTDINLIGGNVAWLAMISYTLQIYFDFSGYSDMAIGLAKMFGFNFLENFNFPYISRSVKEFWQRWHISLSNWFRDYLYIPLGGNRKGSVATYKNLCIVFLCTGLWHGAQWSFIIWGCLHGTFLILERAFLSKYLERWKIFSHIYMFFVIITTWTFFRIDNFQMIMAMLKKMYFSWNDSSTLLGLSDFVSKEHLTILIAALIFAIPWHKIVIVKNTKVKTFLEYSHSFFLMGLFLLCIMSLASNTYNPFIYFRF